MIDMTIASRPLGHLTELGRLVKQYGREWKRVEDLNGRLDFQESCLIFSDSEVDIAKYSKEVSDTEHLISLITHKELTHRSGPVALSLDPILKTHRITPQAYHSRSFVGNHCHKYIQQHVYTQLAHSLVTKTQSCTYDLLVIEQAQTQELIFNDLNASFSQVHNAISHSKHIDTNSLASIQTAIDNYMATYRRHFPNHTIPKQHILEKHCTTFIQHFHCGLGLLGEQGTENSHQQVKLLEKRACGINNESERLLFIMKAILLRVSPHVCQD